MVKVDIDFSFKTQNESFQTENAFFQSETTNVNEILADLDFEGNEKSAKLGKNIYAFLKNHPLCDTYAMKVRPENDKVIPNFIGATLPHRDQGDRELYCSTMLAFFHLWHTGKDLKNESETWDDAFTEYPFNGFQKQLMNTFNIRYECLDARDDYRAQLKKGSAPFAAS